MSLAQEVPLLLAATALVLCIIAVAHRLWRK